MLNVLPVPEPRKQRAFRFEPIDERRHPRVAEGMTEVGTELRQQPPRAVLQVWNQRSSGFLSENEAQQIALVVAVEPTGEKSDAAARFQQQAFQIRSRP